MTGYLLRAPLLTLAIVVPLMSAPLPGLALAQTSSAIRPRPAVRRAVRRVLQRVVADRVDPRAAEALRLFLRTGLRTPYIAHETTRLYAGRGRTSEQIVKHAGPGRVRIDYVAPPTIGGEVVVLTGQRMFRYSPRLGKILEGPLLGQEDIDQRLRGLLGGVRRGNVSVSYLGTGKIAGRPASIVEIASIRGDRRSKRLWIDEKTGVRLKIEDRDARGAMLSSSEYTSIELDPKLTWRDTAPAALPNVPHEAIVPGTTPLTTVEAAQRLVHYPVRQPALPRGFHLDGAWVVTPSSPRPTAILRYTNGVTTVTLYQRPVPAPGILDRPDAPARTPRLVRGGMIWTTSDRLYYLVGYLKPADAERLVASLK